MLELLGNRLLCFLFRHKMHPVTCVTKANGDIVPACNRCHEPAC